MYRCISLWVQGSHRNIFLLTKSKYRKCLPNLLIASTYQDYFEICGLNLAKCHDTVHFVQTSKKMKNSSVEKENCTFGVS